MEATLFEHMKVIFSCYRWRFFQASVMVLISNCLLILNPLIFRQAVLEMSISNGRPGGMGYGIGGTTSLGIWIALLLCIAIVSAFFKYFMRIAFISVSRDAEKEVRAKLFARIQSQSMAFFDKHGIGELLSRLTNDISAYRDVLGPGIMYPIFFLTLVIPGLCALFSISPILTSISLVPLLTIPLLNLTMRRSVYQMSYFLQEGLGTLSNMSQEHYSGIRIIKGYAVEPQFTWNFSTFCRKLIALSVKLNCFQGLLFPFFTMLTKMITVILVVFSGAIILYAWGHLNTADFVSFMWLQSYIFFQFLCWRGYCPCMSVGERHMIDWLKFTTNRLK